MGRFRLSEPAQSDIARALTASEQRFGLDARRRYRACISAALRRVAADPEGLSTADRSDLAPGLRSFHIRHSRLESREPPVAAPVHVLFYRQAARGLIEVARVLHERMDPARHLAP